MRSYCFYYEIYSIEGYSTGQNLKKFKNGFLKNSGGIIFQSYPGFLLNCIIYKSMISFKEWLLSENKEEINGWLSPNGKLYTCYSPFCHSNLILDTPELKKYVKESSIETANDTGGVEYIYFDMWKNGFLRVSSGVDLEMYFEGTSLAIKNLYQKAKDIAESYGRREVFLKASEI